MKIKIFTTPTFNREYKRLKKKYNSLKTDIEKLEKDFSKNPFQGIDLGSNIRKVRIAISSKNKGKRGGGRIITYDLITSIKEKEILFVTIFDKNEIETIPIAKIKSIIRESGL